jgi:hypothetical protein
MNEKFYSIQEIIQYYFNEGCYNEDDNFIRLPAESKYRLIQATEVELGKMQNAGKVKDYITFDHILCIISNNKDFLTENQLSEIEKGLEDK